MYTDSRTVTKDASHEVTNRYASTTENNSLLTNQVNCTSPYCEKTNPGTNQNQTNQNQTNDQNFLLSSLKEQNDQYAIDSSALTLDEMDNIARRSDRVDNCIHKKIEVLAANNNPTNPTNPTYSVDENLARGLQRGEPVDGADAGQNQNSNFASGLNGGGSIRELNRFTDYGSIPGMSTYIDIEEHLAFASADASKMSRSLQRGQPKNDNDRIDASQGGNGDVSSCLQGGGFRIEITTAVTNNMVHFPNISSTSTDKCTYFFLPEEETDTAAAAAKSVSNASAINETGRSTKEAAAKEVSTYFLF